MKIKEQSYQSLIIRYLTEECTAEERSKIEAWLSESDENNRIFEQYQKVWQLEPKSQYGHIHKTAAFKKIEKRINQTEESSIFLAALQPAGRKSRSIYYLAVMAATILIALGIYILFIHHGKPNLIQIATFDGSPEQIILPDNSIVYLNTRSVISYPEKFFGKERRVHLEGSAYLEVSPDNNKPFMVQVGEMEVKVVGTSFDISGYGNKSTIEVAVISGQVLLYKANQMDHQVLLLAGERGIFQRQFQSILKDSITDRNFMAWRTGILEFDQTPLDVVFRNLEETYHIEIKSEIDVSNMRLTARFSQDDPEDIFKTLTLLYGLEIEQEGRQFFVR